MHVHQHPLPPLARLGRAEQLLIRAAALSTRLAQRCRQLCILCSRRHKHCLRRGLGAALPFGRQALLLTHCCVLVCYRAAAGLYKGRRRGAAAAAAGQALLLPARWQRVGIVCQSSDGKQLEIVHSWAPHGASPPAGQLRHVRLAGLASETNGEEKWMRSEARRLVARAAAFDSFAQGGAAACYRLSVD